MSSVPLKHVRRVFANLGATPGTRSKSGVPWTFPNGYQTWLPDRMSEKDAHFFISNARKMFGAETRPWAPGERANTRHPRIDLERLKASAHARHRLQLMQEQADVDYREILHTLRLPDRVLWSDTHEAWVWVRDRLAVPVVFTPSGFGTITTVLWAEQELFEQYPRPRSV